MTPLEVSDNMQDTVEDQPDRNNRTGYPAADLENHTLALARKIASKSALTVAIGKEAFYRQAELPLAEAYAYTKEVMVANLEARDAQEGINAFIDKREPVWCGC